MPLKCEGAFCVCVCVHACAHTCMCISVHTPVHTCIKFHFQFGTTAEDTLKMFKKQNKSSQQHSPLSPCQKTATQCVPVQSVYWSYSVTWMELFIMNSFCTEKLWTNIGGPSRKFPNISRKNFSVLPWSYSALSPSKYSPLLCMHRCQHFFNVLKHSWKAVLGILCKCASEFVLIGSVDSKWQPFSVELSFGNRKKSAGARSGEYGGCGRTVIACLAKKSRKRYDECEGVLSCWSIHRFSRHASGLFFFSWLPHEDVA